jgi:hypothetical protein
VLSDTGLCDGPIARPEESYRVWCVCDLETSTKGDHRPTRAVEPRTNKGSSSSLIFVIKRKAKYNFSRVVMLVLYILRRSYGNRNLHVFKVLLTCIT